MVNLERNGPKRLDTRPVNATILHSRNSRIGSGEISKLPLPTRLKGWRTNLRRPLKGSVRHYEKSVQPTKSDNPAEHRHSDRVCQVCRNQKTNRGKVIKCCLCDFRCHQKCTFPELTTALCDHRGWICEGCAQENYWRCGLPIHYDYCCECGKAGDGLSLSCPGCRYAAHFDCGRMKDGYCRQCKRGQEKALDLFNWSPVFEHVDGRTCMLITGKTVVFDEGGATSRMNIYLSQGEVVNWTRDNLIRTADGAVIRLVGSFCLTTARRIWCDRELADREIYKPCTWVCCVLQAEPSYPLWLMWQCLIRYNDKHFPMGIFSKVKPVLCRAIRRYISSLPDPQVTDSSANN